MAEREENPTLTERIYALLAYTSAGTIFMIGSYLISLAIEDAIMSDPWQIILAVMALPVLTAVAVSCGNHHENRRVRAATWMIVVPLGAINPIAWLGALVLLARIRLSPAQQSAAGD